MRQKVEDMWGNWIDAYALQYKLCHEGATPWKRNLAQFAKTFMWDIFVGTTKIEHYIKRMGNNNLIYYVQRTSGLC